MLALGTVLSEESAQVVNGAIRVRGTDLARVAELVRALVLSGIDVHAAIPVVPSLEDVYLAVHQPPIRAETP